MKLSNQTKKVFNVYHTRLQKRVWFGIGCLFLVASLIQPIKKSITTSYVTPVYGSKTSFNKEITSEPLGTIKPTRVQIGIDVIDTTVSAGYYREGIWSTSDTEVNFLDASSRLDGGGNTIIYGHNKKSLFGPLPQIRVGEIIRVTGSDGNEYQYKITERVVVDPSEVSYIQPTDEPTLTLYTCTGLLDSKRAVLVAKKID